MVKGVSRKGVAKGSIKCVVDRKKESGRCIVTGTESIVEVWVTERRSKKRCSS